MNKVFLIGRLTKSPELKELSSGTSVCRFSIAVNRTHQGENAPSADFFTVTAWRTLGENCAKFLDKGKQCAVLGRVENRTYESNGEKRTLTEIVAESVEFLGGKSNDSDKMQQKLEDLPDYEDDSKLPF